MLKNELSRYAREIRESVNAEENFIAKIEKIKKNLQNLVDTNPDLKGNKDAKMMSR